MFAGYCANQIEHIIREENMMAAQEIIELFCELISVRLPIIESQRSGFPPWWLYLYLGVYYRVVKYWC